MCEERPSGSTYAPVMISHQEDDDPFRIVWRTSTVCNPPPKTTSSKCYIIRSTDMIDLTPLVSETKRVSAVGGKDVAYGICHPLTAENSPNIPEDCYGHDACYYEVDFGLK